jgi:two-component system cell cycle response regulator DivK
MYMVTYLLENAGFEVVQARNGRDGIALAVELPPDVILLDIQLPEMDGYEVAEKLRENSSLVSVPIVAVTSYAMLGDRERVLAAGYTDYLEKPIDTATFVESVASHIRVTEKRS